MGDDKKPAAKPAAKPAPVDKVSLFKALKDMPVRGGIVRVGVEFRDLCVQAIGKNKLSEALAAVKPVTGDPVPGSLSVPADLVAKALKHLGAKQPVAKKPVPKEPPKK